MYIDGRVYNWYWMHHRVHWLHIGGLDHYWSWVVNWHGVDDRGSDNTGMRGDNWHHWMNGNHRGVGLGLWSWGSSSDGQKNGESDLRIDREKGGVYFR